MVFLYILIKEMIEKSLLILILILQALFTGLIISNNEHFFNWESFTSLFQSIVLVVGFFVGYFLLQKEILFNRRLQVHEKLTNMLIEGIHRSFYALSPYIFNAFAIEKSNPKNKDDYFTKQLQDHRKELIQKVSNLRSDILIFYEFFQSWKLLFSEKLHNELKFLFDLETIFGEDLWEYQMKLSDYAMLSLMKEVSEIEKEKKELLFLEERVRAKSNILANGLDKFISDMSQEVFKGLLIDRRKTESNPFSLELENLNNSDSILLLTEKGFVYEPYKKTSFQNKFGGFKERRKKLRKFLEAKYK